MRPQKLRRFNLGIKIFSSHLLWLKLGALNSFEQLHFSLLQLKELYGQKLRDVADIDHHFKDTSFQELHFSKFTGMGRTECIALWGINPSFENRLKEREEEEGDFEKEYKMWMNG